MLTQCVWTNVIADKRESLSRCRAGANSGPELDCLANSNSRVGIGIELAFPRLTGIGIELELP